MALTSTGAFRSPKKAQQRPLVGTSAGSQLLGKRHLDGGIRHSRHASQMSFQNMDKLGAMDPFRTLQATGVSDKRHVSIEQLTVPISRAQNARQAIQGPDAQAQRRRIKLNNSAVATMAPEGLPQSGLALREGYDYAPQIVSGNISPSLQYLSPMSPRASRALGRQQQLLSRKGVRDVTGRYNQSTSLKPFTSPQSNEFDDVEVGGLSGTSRPGHTSPEFPDLLAKGIEVKIHTNE